MSTTPKQQTGRTPAVHLQRLVRRSKRAKLFSKLDMIRWARYLTSGKYSEAAIQGSFTSWHDGPEYKQWVQWV